MNFALLGGDTAALPLLEAISVSEHRLVRTALAELFPLWDSFLASIPLGGWEELLTDAAVEGVIVAGDSDELLFAAKQLASAGKPLLIVPKAAFGDASAYELSLIRDDSHVVLMPVFAYRANSELVSLSQSLTAGESGTMRRLQIEVVLPTSASATQSSGLTDREIDEAALSDIDLLRWLGGNYDQVTALRSGQTEQGCSQAALSLAGTGLPDATWIARRGTTRTWKLTIEAERGTITSQCEGDRAGTPTSDCLGLVTEFASACRKLPSLLPITHSLLPSPPDWSDAVRVFDVLDAARRSLRRRRTIDLHFEALSERSQFKTQMTAIGCGLLLLTLVLMLGLLGLGSLLDARDRNVREAASLGLLLQETDFERHTAVLTTEGQSRLAGIARRLTDEPKSVFVEPTSDPPSSELDQRRRVQVVERLHELRVVAADHRTQLAPPKNSVWETVMRILRLAWIAPLVLFLILQLLLFMARPSTSGR